MTIDQVKEAIREGEQLSRNLYPIHRIKILSGDAIRHTLNALASRAEYYLEAGVYCGGSFCAATFNNTNLKGTCAIDNWGENFHYQTGRDAFKQNVAQFFPKDVPFTLIEKNHWEVEQLPFTPDLYYYDGKHDALSQEKALTHFGPMCAEKFVYCVDDLNNAEVKTGTYRGLERFNVLYRHEVFTPFNARTLTSPYVSPYWNGFGIYLLEQK